MPFEQRRGLMDSPMINITDSVTGKILETVPQDVLTAISRAAKSKLQGPSSRGHPVTAPCQFPIPRFSRLVVQDIVRWMKEACTYDPISPIRLTAHPIEVHRALHELRISPYTAKMDDSMWHWIGRNTWDEVYTAWRTALREKRQPILQSLQTYSAVAVVGHCRHRAVQMREDALMRDIDEELVHRMGEGRLIASELDSWFSVLEPLGTQMISEVVEGGMAAIGY